MRRIIDNLVDAAFGICVIVLALALYEWLHIPAHQQQFRSFQVYAI